MSLDQMKYQPVVKKPNPFRLRNPLKRGTGKVVGLEDRISTLQNSIKWKRSIKEWTESGDTVDLSRIPKVAMVKLSKILIDEDIQRALDAAHCGTIINKSTFDPALLQTLQCIKTKTGDFISIDGQHTSTIICGMIEAGLFDGITDWREFEFSVQYITTDNLAFARRAFSILNGRGKKRQSKYQELRNSVFVVRIDGDTSYKEDVDVERKVSIAENYDCFPIEQGTQQLPGTFTHVAKFVKLSDNIIELTCKWHDTYFHYENMDSSEWFVFESLYNGFKSAKREITDEFLEEIAGVVQSLFGSMEQFKVELEGAFKAWSLEQYGYAMDWKPDCQGPAMAQLYKKLGGTAELPRHLLEEYSGSGSSPDLIDFMSDDITSFYI